MRRVKVKVCGLKREEDLRTACGLGADMVGFVVEVPSSPRSLSLDEAARLIKLVPDDVISVIVVVSHDLERVSRAYNTLKPDLIQIHGPLDIKRFKEEAPEAFIVKALGVSSAQVIEEALSSYYLVNGFLADSPHPEKHGGTGLVHNWDLSKILKEAVYPKPLILAGGLNPENVERAVRYVKPYAVDVSSGIESSPGSKDPEKLRVFIRKAKGVLLEDEYPDPW
ncbi:MAG: phosphoribosylanthranilate isomerase [Candidatus Korarchaeum sp.]